MSQPDQEEYQGEGQGLPEEAQAPAGEAPAAQGPYVCKYCGESFPALNLLGVHSLKCAKRKEALEAKKREERRAETIYKTEAEPNVILEDILSKHPDITPKIKEEVMDWARLKGMLQPMEVQAILESCRGIAKTTAQIIASKYAFALQKEMQEGRAFYGMPLVPTPTATPQPILYPSFTFPQPQPTPTLTPPQSQIQIPPPSPTSWQMSPPTVQPTQFPQAYPQPTPQYPPSYDVRGIIREELRTFMEEREKRAKEALETGYVEIERVVRDKDGNVIIGPDEKPIIEKMKVPASQAHLFMREREPSLDVEALRKELQAVRDEIRSKELEKLKEELQEIRRRAEEKPPPETSPPEELIDKAVKRAMEEKEKERREEERWNRLEKVIREAVSAKTVEGYREDSYRVIGQGLSEIASVVKERKPIEVIVREGGQLLLGTPAPKEVEEGAEPESILDRLKKRGWVVEE